VGGHQIGDMARTILYCPRCDDFTDHGGGFLPDPPRNLRWFLRRIFELYFHGVVVRRRCVACLERDAEQQRGAR
jgi:hypothetical protein